MIKNKKGFTLIEIIVVVVILAVLMAVAVPSVLKYLDEADDAKYMAQARSAYTIMKTEITKALALDEDKSLSSADVENIIERTDFSEIANLSAICITGMTIDGNNLSSSDSLITINKIPENYYFIFGVYDEDTNQFGDGRYITYKENEIVDVSKQYDAKFYPFIFVNQ
ncbi:prepilin-type N-terminal cleavage/methylation domain-containing protein [Candidatus Stoquefichus massiliensis]|uniref:prepilin-type N-terminal cleavage/methylation domain-containing protein n=1 Tax=Candidatus Stoquefichus massiliensis TaxID=1470350 RepID=UPI0004B64FA5|nr:prepilin-type N-terminal cleavage/methylation domain-containing protein [Candidatus Stoquefichus massiliensis]